MVEELKTIEVGFTDYIAARQKEFDWFRQGKEQGYEEGISIGLERGAYQNKLETAKSFLAEGLHPEIVARCTNLPLDIVLELRQEK